MKAFRFYIFIDKFSSTTSMLLNQDYRNFNETDFKEKLMTKYNY